MGPFGEITDLEWCVLLESGEETVSYRVEGLTTERALVLGELYRRDGSWRLRAVGQGWEGGLAGLDTDYGVSIATGKQNLPRWAVFFAVCRSPGFMIVPGRMVL